MLRPEHSGEVPEETDLLSSAWPVDSPVLFETSAFSSFRTRFSFRLPDCRLFFRKAYKRTGKTFRVVCEAVLAKSMVCLQCSRALPFQKRDSHAKRGV